METTTEKERRLRGELRRHANGAAVESMNRQGLHYGANWGVPLHTIRAIASRYAPDHLLAHHLYVLPLRELRLAACMVAQPDAVCEEELDFWAAGIENIEIAETLAFSLLSHTALDKPLINRWLLPEAPLAVRYCALLALGRMVLLNNATLPCGEVVATVSRLAADDSALLAAAAQNILLRLVPQQEESY